MQGRRSARSFGEAIESRIECLAPCWIRNWTRLVNGVDLEASGPADFPRVAECPRSSCLKASQVFIFSRCYFSATMRSNRADRCGVRGLRRARAEDLDSKNRTAGSLPSQMF